MTKITIGLLGLGQIGGGLYSILKSKRAEFARRLGVDFEILKVAVRNRNKKRKVKVPTSLLTTDAEEVIHNPEVDVIVELIGGTKEAYSYVTQALRAGKHVVTANKALLAERGDEIFELASRAKRWVLFEASVGGGIPVVKALRQGLAANRIDSILGIINGTSNYILTRMSQDKLDFRKALAEAQAQGYAEADPALDVGGGDAAHKIAILARFAFGGRVNFDDIYCEGISAIRSEDMEFASQFGYRIKLLAIAKKAKGGIEARVQPALLPESHILAKVDGSYNAVLLRGDEVGDVLLYGKGAGSHPTASAVVSDLVDIAKHEHAYLTQTYAAMQAVHKKLVIKNISSIQSRYYLRFHVVDRPGVLAKISEVLGKNRISISDVIQRERKAGGVVPLILLTHDAHEHDVRKAIGMIDRIKNIRGKAQVIRIEES